MNRFSLIADSLIRRLEFWLLSGLLLWLAIMESRQNQSVEWSNYLRSVGLLLLSQLPVLVFIWFKDGLKQSAFKRTYTLLWKACYIVYLPLLLIICVTLQEIKNIPPVILAGALLSIVFALLWMANTYYQQRMRQGNWIKKISLEKAVLICITVISVCLSAMAVSSLGNPTYDTKEQLLIGFQFDAGKILRNFGVFLAYISQFLLIYLAGYLFFYINSHFLVARLLKQKGIFLYCLSVLATVGFLYPVVGQILAILPLNQKLGHMFSDDPFRWENAFAALAIMLISLPIVLAIQWTRQNNQILSLEKERSRAELDLLKQQLNPHFFFNTLNNLYALSLQQSPQTPETILRLSEFMRYVIYKGQEPQVSIQEEIKYIGDYLQLQQMRLRKPLDLQFNQDISNDKQAIAPLLLIVFIENAFKHGIENAEQEAFLHLYLQVEGKRLYFRCENSVEPGPAKPAGIGLTNLQRRLALLYPGKHVLKTSGEKTTFKAELQLDLS